MDSSSSRQLKDIAAWLVRNESRTRRLTASSRDGRRGGLFGHVHPSGKVASMMCPSQSGQLPSPPPAVPRHIGARSLYGPNEMIPEVPSGNTDRGYAV